MRKLACYSLFCTAFVNAQDLSFGVKGGGIFTDPAGRQDQSRPYVLGPSLELGLASRFAIEGGALYSRFGSSTASVGGGRVRGHVIEFPVLGKYYFSDRGSALRPYVSAGVAFRNIWFDGRDSDGDRRSGSGGRPIGGSTDVGVGAVVGGGVGFKLGFLKIAPEVRYTRWGGYNFPATNADQVQALVGISF